ncbi:hypothetical protein ANCDUO_23653 [Ancylostoma duodenale]|uniref:Uncharacterized protein n=1 Tax=Ancylostoma duodenale TaxID=51022 RepID=A0A0C2C938_9BILA|nr:hypothetical protein ANCDUO_23653 [Ancylostoma duodenale]
MNVQKVRWHGCVTRINSLMPMATSSIYVKHHFDHEAKKQAPPIYITASCNAKHKVLYEQVIGIRILLASFQDRNDAIRNTTLPYGLMRRQQIFK